MRRGLLLVGLMMGVAFGQTPGYYRFGVDQDGLSGAPDFSFLNHTLTAADRVFVRDGHFYTVGADLTPNTDDDQRVRFYGMNLAFGANFPTEEDGVRIAKRLRRLGVNLVRLHHMDSSPDSVATNAGSILTTGPYPAFNPVAVGRLKAFLGALAAEGVYANLNLHVGYTFRPAVDGVPALPNGMPTQGKPLHMFYPEMVAKQKQFAEELIGLLGLKDNPVLAMVETNNETSMVHEWQGGALDENLVGDYAASLKTLWNWWLSAKYATTEALGAAWGSSADDSTDVLPGKFTLETGHGKNGTLAMVTVDGIPTAQVALGSGSGWVFLKQTGFKLKAGVRYVWKFEARADAAAGVKINTPVTVMRDVSPWDGFLYSSIDLTNDWKAFTIAITPSYAIDDSGRVSLDVEYAPSVVQVRKMSLVIAGLKGLAAGESLEAGTVSLLAPGEGATAARLADYAAFLTDTDKAFEQTMLESVRKATDALVPVTGTQMGYAGLSALDSQDGLDYQDNHFYIDHYNFPGTSWDGTNWQFRDVRAGDDTWGVFADMAWARQAGRPYTVSEFNQPWPNTHASEHNPALAAFAAFQDWDGLIHFAYSHGRGWDDGVPNGFNVNGDWTKWPVIGQSAWLFRSGAVQVGAQKLQVPASAAQRVASTAANQGVTTWVTRTVGLPKAAALTQVVELVKDGEMEVPEEAKKAPESVMQAGEMTFDKDRKLVVVAAPQAAGVMGQIGKDKIEAGALDVELAAGARGFATVLATSLDGEELGKSTRILLSVPGYALRALPASGNKAPDSATAVPQKIINYPGSTTQWTIEPTNGPNPSKQSGDLNGGHRPTFMERVEAYVTLRTAAKAIKVTALDGAGQSLGEVETTPAAGGFTIHVNAEGTAGSPWYLVEPKQVRLTATPNPIPVAAGVELGKTTLRWTAPGHASVELRIGAADGPVVAAGGEEGEAETGEWVPDNTTFYLVDVATGEVVAQVTVRLKPAE